MLASRSLVLLCLFLWLQVMHAATVVQPTTNSADGPFPTFDFTSQLQSVLTTNNIPGGVVALISLPSTNQSSSSSSSSSSSIEPTPVCPFNINALNAAGIRRINSPVPVNVNDAFHHGSNTKAMTALLINQQVERGHIRFDQTLVSLFPYLPWSDNTAHSSFDTSAGYFAGSSYATTTTIDASWRNVSIQQLLTHTSGIFTLAKQYNDLQSDMYEIESTMDPVALRRINSTNIAKYPVPSRQFFLQEMLTNPVTYPSSSVNSSSSQGFYYSNYNYILLGCILEELEGRAWEHIIGDLFTQLGMPSAGFGPPEIERYDTKTAPQQPWPHFMSNGVWQPIGVDSPVNAIDNPEALGPAGTVHANLVDWARLTACHLLEGRGENSASNEPASLLLHPSMWTKVHSQFLWPSSGTTVNDYSLSGYFSDPTSSVWGDTILSHDGSNNEWYSRSLLYLHGHQPFAILAAFNAAPPTAADAMTDLFNKVLTEYASGPVNSNPSSSSSSSSSSSTATSSSSSSSTSTASSSTSDAINDSSSSSGTGEVNAASSYFSSSIMWPLSLTLAFLLLAAARHSRF